jgi:hypothetical protein
MSATASAAQATIHAQGEVARGGVGGVGGNISSNSAHLTGYAVGLRIHPGHQRAAQLREMLAQRGVGECLGADRHWSLDRRALHVHFGRRESRLLAGAAVRDQMQLEEHLGHVRRLDLLGQHAHRPERARLAEIQLTFLRGVHHDGDGGGARIVLDVLHGLQAIHSRHLVIHEDHVGTVAAQVLDGRFRALRGVNVDVVPFQGTGQK